MQTFTPNTRCYLSPLPGVTEVKGEECVPPSGISVKLQLCTTIAAGTVYITDLLAGSLNSISNPNKKEP